MVTFIFAGLFAILLSDYKMNKEVPLRLCGIGVLFIFLALRYNYGNDYVAYSEIHSIIQQNGTQYPKDILYVVLNRVIDSFQLLVAILSAFYVYSIYYLLKHTMPIRYWWLSLAMLLCNPYFFLVHLSTFRQTLALCFFIFAVVAGIKRKLILYLVFITLAAMSHKSAVILLPSWFLLKQSKLNRLEFMLGILIPFLILMFPERFEVLVQLVFNYTEVDYSHYLGDKQNSIRSIAISSIFYFILIFSVKKMDTRYLPYAKLALVGSILSLSTRFMPMITRIQMYYDIFYIVALPMIVFHVRDKYVRSVVIFVIIAIYILRMYSFMNNPLWESFTVYRTIFQEL